MVKLTTGARVGPFVGGADVEGAAVGPGAGFFVGSFIGLLDGDGLGSVTGEGVKLFLQAFVPLLKSVWLL